MNAAIFLGLLSLAFTLSEGRWCVGWDRRAGGGEETPRLPCRYTYFDTNTDGKITASEFKKVATKYGQEGTGIVFAILDTNDDDTIEPREFFENAKRLEKLHLMEKCEATRGWNWGWG